MQVVQGVHVPFETGEQGTDSKNPVVQTSQLWHVRPTGLDSDASAATEREENGEDEKQLPG